MNESPPHHRHDHARKKSHTHVDAQRLGHAHDRGLAGFVRYMGLLSRMWRSEISTVVVALVAPQAGEHVVDLGAGMGPASMLAARCGASVLAVDPTPFMRRILSVRRFAQGARQRITVTNGAAESIPAADSSIDALFTVNTMHHWTDLDRAVIEIHRVLRPGGRLLLVDEDFESPTHPEHQQVQAGRAHHAHHFIVIDPADVAARLQRLGFASITGSLDEIAGRPCKVVRGVKA